MTEPDCAVFLSYASQDTEAAQRIGAALRAAGIEVWLDQSELRGGDVWDQKIRREIHACALFIPVISANTAARHEGYFRLEWDLADQRTHRMARNHVFVVPVCLDTTPEQGADVPESFHRVQWTRLAQGETPAAFIERIQRLLSREPLTERSTPVSAVSGTRHAHRHGLQAWSGPGRVVALLSVVVVGTIAYYFTHEHWFSKGARPPPEMTASEHAPAGFVPPPHSIAVLPFVNMSGDASQDYFSDGLTEELLNSLTQINDLQVAARSSAFSFKGQNIEIGTIARKLNVGSILEGSVRRSGPTLRVSAQLINAVTGFQLWSKSYDRDLGNVLRLQTEIATAVAEALKITLLGDVATKIELGGTRNPAALDAYLRASRAFLSRRDTAKDTPAAIASYSEAIRLDPSYALAYAWRSFAVTTYAAGSALAPREALARAQDDARKAIELAPDLAPAHAALAFVSANGTQDFVQADAEYRKALALAPGNAQVLGLSALFEAAIGHFDSAIAQARRAVVLDPLGRVSRSALGRVLYTARRYAKAVAAFADAISINPEFESTYIERGLAFYGLGDLESARVACERQSGDSFSRECLALVYHKLGRRSEAEAELKKYRAAEGDHGAYEYARIYAQWGDYRQALEWLEAAIRSRDSSLIALKTDPLMDPVRNEPRVQQILLELKFPNGF